VQTWSAIKSRKL
jgi:hypothetical protein